MKKDNVAVFTQENIMGPKKEENPVTHSDVGGAGEHYAEWNELGIEMWYFMISLM